MSMWRALLGKVASNARLTTEESLSVLSASEALFTPRTSLVRLSAPKMTICGDVHGQFSDLMKIFSLNGSPSPDNPYLFNGDFVDRGTNSVGCILTLLLHKLIHPTGMHLNRGNHELVEMNSYYGFRKEVGNDVVFKKFNEVFASLPIAHIVNDSVFVVHGGLPRKCVTLEEISRSTPDSSLYHELLWNDPCDTDGIHPNPRGDGVFRFGPDITRTFLDRNKLQYIVRSHEMVNDGFEWSQNGKCCTVFSAPNYAGHFRNKGAWLSVDADGNLSGTAFSGEVQSTRSRL